MTHGLSKIEMVMGECNECAELKPLPQVFGRLLSCNPITGTTLHGKAINAEIVTKAFGIAADAMCSDKDIHSNVPAGLTFFGQFIDHDITLDTQSEIGKRIDPRTIRNVRTPALDMDCVYGDGPDGSPHLYLAGTKTVESGYLLFGTNKNSYDLCRNGKGRALIGDPRNDENLFLSQLQGAMVCFHNLCMTMMESSDKTLMHRAFDGVRADTLQKCLAPHESVYQAARRVVRFHYQWLVLNEFLPAFIDEKVLKHVRDCFDQGILPKPFTNDTAIMPVEFSGAAYRFGHATVQNSYTINGDKRMKLFDKGMKGFKPVDPCLNLEFSKIFDFPGAGKFDFARPVGRKLASQIFELPFVQGGLDIDGHHLPESEAKKLPHRNIFRDRFALQIASGQQVARAMGVPELAAPKELIKHGITKTPLWYYCLQEAEKHEGKLGHVGGTIVATTLLRCLYLDPDSIINAGYGFKPWQEFGANKKGEFSMGHLLKYVMKNRDDVKHRNDLIT